MKKNLKYIFILLCSIVVLGVVFFIVDYNRARKQESPIFCIKSSEFNDGGTREFLGLGYKVIDYHRLNGYNETKIGSIFMKYEDFYDEFSKYDDIVIEEIVKSEEYTKQIENTIIKLDLPKEWHVEEIDNPENKNAKFELKLYKDSKEKSASLFYYNEMFGVCGTGLISKKLNLDNGNEASVGYYDGSNIWNFVAFGNINPNIAILNSGLNEENANELLGIIKTIDITNKQENTNDEYSFLGKIIESYKNYIIVEPNEDELIRKSSDKISIGLGEHNDAIYTVGTNVKITYNGIIMETYPAKINAINIEIKSVNSFEILFYDKRQQGNKINTILNKKELDKYNYNVYAYNGNVNIRIDGKDYSLKEALVENKITMEEIIAKANKDLEENRITGDMYKDGGTMIYKYNNYTIIKCHTVNGNRDVYIGSIDMTLNDINI